MIDLQSQLPIHPVTGLRALDFNKRGCPIWPVMGGNGEGDGGTGQGDGDGSAAGGSGDGDGGNNGDGDQGSGSGNDGDRGFPANTAVKDMTPEQQAAYWKHHDRRKSDTLKAYAGITPDEAKRLKDEAEKRRRDGMGPDERALEDARQEAAAQAAQAAASQWAPTLAEEIATRFIPDDNARTAVMAGIDPLKFVKDGAFDRQAFTDHLTALQTAFGGNGSGGSQPRQWGQGSGRPPSTVKQSDEGLAEARRRGYVKD